MEEHNISKGGKLVVCILIKSVVCILLYPFGNFTQGLRAFYNMNLN